MADWYSFKEWTIFDLTNPIIETSIAPNFLLCKDHSEEHYYM